MIVEENFKGGTKKKFTLKLASVWKIARPLLGTRALAIVTRRKKEKELIGIIRFICAGMLYYLTL